jgi:hypothetical protein
MARKSPKQATLRALFAKSGNVCAFPGCSQELVTNDNLYVGEVCHIEAAEPKGPRFNPESDDEERRSFENLLLMWHAHHRRVDTDSETYPVDRLRQMKAEHESAASRDAFQVDASVIFQVEREMDSYWSAVVERQREHPVADLAVQVDPAAGGTEVFKDLRAQVKRVGQLFGEYRLSDEALPSELKEFVERLGYEAGPLESVPYYENPFEQRNWEFHNLGSPNVLTDLTALLLQAELLYLSEWIKLHTSDEPAKLRMRSIKEELADIAGSGIYHD